MDAQFTFSARPPFPNIICLKEFIILTKGTAEAFNVRKALIGTFIRFRFAAFSLIQGYRLLCHKYLLRLNIYRGTSLRLLTPGVGSWADGAVPHASPRVPSAGLIGQDGLAGRLASVPPAGGILTLSAHALSLGEGLSLGKILTRAVERAIWAHWT